MTTMDGRMGLPDDSAARARNFIIVASVLLAAAVGLNFTVAKLQLYFKKEPVPMRMTFMQAMPEVIEAKGPGTDMRGRSSTVARHWVQVCRDENLEPDLQASLATDQFLFCSYIEAEAFNMTPEQVQARFKGQPLAEQRRILASDFLYDQSGRHADSVVQVGLTYYTGKADTVAHIPERCYVGGGYDPVDPQNLTWTLPNGRSVDVRSIAFEASGANEPPRNVAYLFQVNGHYTNDSLAVRADLQDLFAKHGYYAKIELMCISGDPILARGGMQRFLGAALGDIERALPDWNQYRTRK